MNDLLVARYQAWADDALVEAIRALDQLYRGGPMPSFFSDISGSVVIDRKANLAQMVNDPLSFEKPFDHYVGVALKKSLQYQNLFSDKEAYWKRIKIYKFEEIKARFHEFRVKFRYFSFHVDSYDCTRLVSDSIIASWQAYRSFGGTGFPEESVVYRHILLTLSGYFVIKWETRKGDTKYRCIPGMTITPKAAPEPP